MITSHSFAAEEPGPHLLIFGAVHGNEKCGTLGIRRVMPEIESGALKLIRGSVTFVPICNPRAYEQDVRFIERNLNRYLVPNATPDCYEAKLGNILCPMLANCDVLLDLHSYTVGGPAFVFVGEGDKRGQEFAANLGDCALLTGWASAYAASGRAAGTNKDESVGTTEYARRFGAVSVTLECGQHKDPGAADIATAAIHNALRYLGMVESADAPKKNADAATLVTVRKVFYRQDAGALAKAWKHMDAVKTGEAIAHQADGTAITAPGDGYIILPHADTLIGTEWFYFGTAN